VQLCEIVCTTPWNTSDASVSHAKAVAGLFAARYVSRRERSIHRLFQDESCRVLIVAEKLPKLYHRLQPDKPLFFHPSMAAQRIQRMQRGEPDRLIRAAGVTAGDVVVDATLGLGTDSLVFASAVGENGHVIGLESISELYRLFLSAKRFGAAVYTEVKELLARIHPVFCHHLAWLNAQADNSVDVIYFDPMFQIPSLDSPAIQPLRQFADPHTVSEESWEQACRVARKCVVLKERPESELFKRFHIPPDKRRGRIAYGVWRKR